MLADIGYVFAGIMSLLVISGALGMFHRKRRLSSVLTIVLVLAMFATSVYIIVSGDTGGMFGILNISALSSLFVALFSAGLVLVEILAYSNSSDIAPFNMLLGFSAVGMFLVSMAGSVLIIFLAIELVSVPTALMILIGGKRHLEAATKLFVMSAVSIAVFAFAMALIMPFDPSLSLTLLVSNPGIHGSYMTLLAMALFIASLGIEGALFPFNLWIPDVYEGAQGHITALLSGINKKVMFVALMYILFVVFLQYKAEFSIVLEVLAVLTMLFGNIIAMVQNNVKRMLAYSSISQAGYILIGFAVATHYGLQASVFQIFVHVFMTIGAFSVVMWMESKSARTIGEYRGLVQRSPFLAISLSVLMLSMAGIPPLGGFMGKFMLFSSAIDSGMILLAFIGIINSFISIYYYGKVISSMFQSSEKQYIHVERSVAFVILVCLILVVMLGLYPQPLIAAISNALPGIVGVPHILISSLT